MSAVGDARKRLAETPTDDREAQEVEALAALLWQADRDASPSGHGFGATFREDPCGYSYRSQARAILASDWLAARDAQRDRAAGEKALRDAADDCLNIAFECNEDVQNWLRELAPHAHPLAGSYVCRHGKVAGEHWCDDLSDRAAREDGDA